VPPAPRAGLWSKYGTALVFLAPTILLLAVWYVYPTIYTVWRSFKSADGSSYVGIDNYKEIFTDDVLFTAIRNNAIWVAVVPATVTALGLVFAVLVERISWSTAFKFAVFAPLAISLFAAGVIWRATMYNKDPEIGTINAVLGAVHDTVKPTGVLADANPSTDALKPAGGGMELSTPLQAGGSALLGLTAISEDEVPSGAEQAAQPESAAGGITGVVWRDFKPGGGTPGRVESGELGLPGVTIELKDSSGDKVASTDSEENGSFRFEDLEGSGPYTVAIGSDTFAEPYEGVTWLGPKLITPAMIIAYLWTAAGFSMVVIGAGLASLPRDVLEAARTDGATELQVFRRVTVPLLKPVLLVVFVTQIIGVLKVFDIILSIAPGSVWNDATVLAFEMWRQSFQFNNFGVGAALAVFLFLLVIPIIILNIRNFRREL
jgi:alpha-glucoside transport system permease protein